MVEEYEVIRGRRGPHGSSRGPEVVPPEAVVLAQARILARMILWCESDGVGPEELKVLQGAARSLRQLMIDGGSWSAPS